MPPVRRQTTGSPTAWIRTYLTAGVWRRGDNPHAPTIEEYAVVRWAFAGPQQDHPLAELWKRHGPEIVRDWRGPGKSWAQEMLENQREEHT
jgi:hypothetical protein